MVFGSIGMCGSFKRPLVTVLPLIWVSRFRCGPSFCTWGDAGLMSKRAIFVTVLPVASTYCRMNCTPPLPEVTIFVDAPPRCWAARSRPVSIEIGPFGHVGAAIRSSDAPGGSLAALASSRFSASARKSSHVFGPPTREPLLGAFSTLDSGVPLWLGLSVGGLVGVLFRLAFGGVPKWKVWDAIFG